MKRIFTFGLMLTAVFALTNCTEELVDQTVPSDEVTQETVTPKEEGIPFQVYASLGAETKTEGYIDDKTGKLKTKWISTDKIHVFYEDEEGTLVNAGEFGFGENPNDDDVANGLFSGFLPSGIDADKTYNWYFVYDITKTGPITLVDNQAPITIAQNGQRQTIVEEGSKDDEVKHLGSTNCPMWGCALNISGSLRPRVQMGHLVSLYEITVQNQTNDTTKPSNTIASPGNIMIYNVGLKSSTSGVWLETGQQKALYGNFNLNVKTGKLVQELTNKNYSLNLNLSSSVELEPGEEHKFYFVAAPVDIQSKETTETRYQHKTDATIITKEEYDTLVAKDKNENTNVASNYKAIEVTKRLDVLEFLVNGSARPLPARNAFAFANGAVYKYTLPVWRMSHPYASDAFNLKSVGTPINEVAHIVENVITTSAEEPTTINVNGQNVPAYVIGDEAGNTGTVSITGFADDLFDALPIGFYTSAWNNEPAEMTVKEVIVNAPVFYEETTSSTEDIKLNSDNRPIERLITNKLTVDFTELESRDGQLEIKVLGWPVNIPLNLNRDMLGMLGGSVLEKITFSGMPAQGRYDDANDSHNVIVMNEAYSYKEINSANMDTFIQNFGKGASMSGVEEILNISNDYLPESYTITEVIRKTNEWESYWLFGTHWRETNVVEKVESVTVEPTWPGSLQDTHPNLVSTVNTVYNLLLSKSLNFYNIATVTLAGMDGLIPSQWHLIYYLREALLNVTLTTTENGPRMIFWGLDAMGPNKSPQNNSAGNEGQSAINLPTAM